MLDAETPETAEATTEATETETQEDVTAGVFDDAAEVDSGTKDGAETDADAEMLSDDDLSADEGVPDQYTFDPPEGLEIDEDMQARLDQFSETAKGLKLTQEQYQGLVEYDLERSRHLEETAVDDWNKRVAGWQETARADKEIGGEASAQTRNLALAALAKYGTAAFSSLLKRPSPENPQGLELRANPEMLRFLSRVGKDLGDPETIEGGSAAPTSTAEARMYPTMNKKT